MIFTSKHWVVDLSWSKWWVRRWEGRWSGRGGRPWTWPGSRTSCCTSSSCAPSWRWASPKGTSSLSLMSRYTYQPTFFNIWGSNKKKLWDKYSSRYKKCNHKKCVSCFKKEPSGYLCWQLAQQLWNLLCITNSTNKSWKQNTLELVGSHLKLNSKIAKKYFVLEKASQCASVLRKNHCR